MIKTGQEKFAGVQYKFGETSLIIPSLTLRQAKELWPEILELDKQGASVDTMITQWDKGLKIIYAAMSRNYPDATVDEVSDLLELRTWAEVLKIVAGQSGLKVSEPGEQTPAVADSSASRAAAVQ